MNTLLIVLKYCLNFLHNLVNTFSVNDNIKKLGKTTQKSTKLIKEFKIVETTTI